MQDTTNPLSSDQRADDGPEGEKTNLLNENKRQEAKDEDHEAAQHSGFKVHDRRFWRLEEHELAQEEDRSQLPTYVEQLKAELEEKDKQLREYISAYKKEVVEGLEKTKQRLERESAMKLEQVRGQVVLPMLEVLDALERSIAAVQQEVSNPSFYQGVKMVHQLMMQKLSEVGLTRIETMGQRFDPSIHEAVSVVHIDDKERDNVITTEIKAGFSLGSRVIRPALVQVGKLS